MVALALHPDGMLPAVRDLTPRRDVRAQAVRYLRDTGRVSEPVRPNPLPGFWRSFASSSRQGDRGGARPGTRGPRRYREDTAIHQRADCSKIACQQLGSGFAEHIRFQETPRVASAKLGSSSYSKYDMAIVKRPQASIAFALSPSQQSVLIGSERSASRMIQKSAFQTRARTVDHLGREQIADCPTAISELWKNAFDAYARKVELTIYDGDEPVARHRRRRPRDEQRGVHPTLAGRGGPNLRQTVDRTPVGDRNGLNLRPRTGPEGYWTSLLCQPRALSSS